jgi:integrase/recombinase XerD
VPALNDGRERGASAPRHGGERKAPRRTLASFGVMGARVAEFLESRLARHHSVRTVEWTESNLRRFLEWCEERSLRNPTEVTRPILERYQRWLFYYRTKAGRPLSVASQHKRLAAVLAFFRWMAKSNLILFNPASELELPRLDRRLPRQVLSISEVEQILSLPDVAALGGIRDRAILETLYSTGIRRSELANLGLYDIQADSGTLMVRLGKGRKDRVVPIGERALGWIEKYLVEVRPHLVVEPDDGALFVSHLGHAFTPHHLTDIVRDYIEKAAIGKTGSCHLFRHTMATLMLESGADIRFIQAMLGHAKLETTSVYTYVSIRKLKEVHELTHPGSRLGRRAPTERTSPPAPATTTEREASPAVTAEDAAAELLASLAAEAEEEQRR